ncbi:MAG: methyltransferase domain-containing protein [Chloroflexi bacterium]|nr:methyltransferase domain-containing protein [Chloroflexota bacterium]
MHKYVIDMLVCPACHGELVWEIEKQTSERLHTAVANCLTCQSNYPVRDEIGIFLLPDLPRNDMWEQVDSNLMKFLRDHPEVERQLMEPPLEAISPADQMFRSMVLDEKGQYAEAKQAEETAQVGLYTNDYLTCWSSQVDFLLAQLGSSNEPIVDLASGRGYLVEKLIQQRHQPIIATDFSPRVLRRNRLYLSHFGYYDRVTLLAFDARRTPFRDNVVPLMTTNLGLPNIEKPGALGAELGRIVNGRFLGVSFFFPEDDEVNAKVIWESGLETFLYRETAVSHFHHASWRVKIMNSCVGAASPTPTGKVLEGVGVDGIPITDTELEWCILHASTHK